MLKFSRRKLMQWAGKGALGSFFLGGLFGRRASAQSVPFVDLSLAGVTDATPRGTGLHLLDQMGRIFTLGTAPPLDDASIIPCVHPSPYVAMVRMPAISPFGYGPGGLVTLTADGQFHAFGIFEFKGGLENLLTRTSPLPVQPLPLVALAVHPNGQGLWALDLMGRLRAFGGATDFGPGTFDPCYRPSPYVGLVPTLSGGGLYALTQNGQIRTFGAAPVLGDGTLDPCVIPAPFVALAITPTGAGLWALDLLGKVRTLGTTTPLGDGAMDPCVQPTPYVAMVPTPSGDGLYALTLSGQLQTFGDAQNFSTTPR